MITVYHYLPIVHEDGKPTIWGLEAVAEVYTNNPGVAFEQTNHIDESWTLNPGVTLLVESMDVRSTSVGDVMELNGNWYIVADFGFIYRGTVQPEVIIDVSPADYAQQAAGFGDD